MAYITSFLSLTDVCLPFALQFLADFLLICEINEQLLITSPMQE